MRGLERDRLVEDATFKRFLPNAESNGKTAYLVCTSAGEVGINISADQLICDLTPFDSMTQRFGRVNRFGKGDATIGIVHQTKFGDDPLDERRKRTLKLLKQLDGDGSSAAIGQLPPEERLAAFTPEPEILAVSDILLDAWALTTLHDELPGRPPVTDYLHGVAEWQPPETHVAWRTEVEWINGDLLATNDPEELLADYPLKPHELLRDRYDRVFKHLQRLAELDAGAPAWVIAADEVKVTTLGEIAAGEKELLADAMVLLPPSIGGLSAGGMLGDEPGFPGLDVADEWFEDEERKVRRRVRLLAYDENLEAMTAGMRLVQKVVLRELSEEDDADGAQRRREWCWYVRPKSADDEGSRTALAKQLLDPHNAAVGTVATKIADALQLKDPIRSALVFAGHHHDDGKNRKSWQLSIGNRTSEVWAKSGNRRPPEIRIDYRHEFGSVLDIIERQEFKALSPNAQELVLHLIAAHHGRARPHFPEPEVFDPNHPDKVAAAIAREVPRRFARLQRKYGRWGLAYLESLLRAADAYASANPEGSA